MKKILGLDLGTNSIGWALVAEDNKKKEILGLGSRIIPYSDTEGDDFSKGTGVSKNQQRTEKRSSRRGYDRYILRRKYLIDILKEHNMLPDESLVKLNKLELWDLRSKASNNKISLQEFGRILLHLNQKRGYKSSRSDANLNKKDTEYVSEVKSRFEKLKETGQTIGQYFYSELKKDEFYRIKQQVYPREAYIEEFERVCKSQQQYYSEITDEFINKLRDEIIYYQRKLKSQKGLVSVCEFAGFHKKVSQNGKEKILFVGPKVAPKSSPLFQICKIWETINNITLKNKNGEIIGISIEKKNEIFEYLENNEKLSFPELLKILNLKKGDGWYGNKQLEKGLQGNLTKCTILNSIGAEKMPHLFELKLTLNRTNKEVYLYDQKTGEILGNNIEKVIAPEIEQQPLYKLWHVIYSIPDTEECTKTIINKFQISKEVAEKLAAIDFTKQSFGNKSVKAIRKILPYLMEGYLYSDACSLAGYNHSDSQTKDKNLKRQLLDKLPNLAKNSLRQPVVEKILNQMINLVNAVIEKYGKPDEIRVELARELKQSRDERNDTFSYINKRERENKVIEERLIKEYGLRATRNNIIKWRLFHEINNDESKLNSTCIYCGQPFGITAALKGNEVDVEHIIPKSRLFDDSQNNKTLSHRKCNEEKGDRTAYDYMKSKSEVEFNHYIERIEHLYKEKIINKSKRDKLLMPSEKIPVDFIERQLRETQYISRKSREILINICREVWSTSGGVTAYLRRTWGWDDALMNLQLPKYKLLDLTEFIEFEKNEQIHKKEVIKGWSKRDDHRHHAIDALTIACTQQGYVQRINTLNSDNTKNIMFESVRKGFDNKKSLLENYIFAQKPFTTKEVEEAASNILVSFKAGKKVATIGKRIIKKNGKKEVVQTGIIVPRGSLSQESVYGKIKTMETNKPIKYLFENPELIVKQRIKKLVSERVEKFENNIKKALSSLKKEPIYLDEDKKIELAFGTCYKEEYVIKYPIESIKSKDVGYIIDNSVKEIIRKRLEQFGNKEKEAFKDLNKNPVWYNEEKRIPIKTVRCFTGLSAVEPVKKNENGQDISYIKPGNNHHIAIYVDENDKKQEHVVTFWHAVERRKYKFPIIIKNSKAVWDIILQDTNAYTNSFVNNLPDDKWTFEISLQQNEMFVLGLTKEDAEKAIEENNYKLLSNNLYRIQKLARNNYVFRHHLETQLNDSKESANSNRFYLIQSLDALLKLNPIKIRVNNLGEIVKLR